MTQTNAIKAALGEMARAATWRVVPWIGVAVAAVVAAAFALAALWAVLEDPLGAAGASAAIAAALAIGAGIGALALRRRSRRRAAIHPRPEALSPALMVEVFLAAMRAGRSAGR